MKPFERSEITTRLVDYLRSHDKGSHIPYRELTPLVGQAINAKSTNLTSARKILERDHNAIWVCVVPHVGIRRLNDAEIADRLRVWWMRGARRKLDRGGDQIDVVETQNLDIDQQARFSIDCIQRELAFNSLSRATRQRMEKVARGSSNDLPSFNVLEWAISLTPRKQPQP
jgi:hypothetical protein